MFSDGLTLKQVVSEISGRGVGLGAVRAVVTAMGGKIEIDSVDGGGTLFVADTNNDRVRVVGQVGSAQPSTQTRVLTATYDGLQRLTAVTETPAFIHVISRSGLASPFRLITRISAASPVIANGFGGSEFGRVEKWP